MSTLLNMRAHRVVLLSVAAIMVVSLLAPIAATANTDLVPGDSAVVSGSEGANLRADTSLSDESIIGEIPAGATVWVQDGPYFEDTGVWVYVATDGYGPGFVTTSLLSRINNEEVAEANGVPAEEPVAVEEEPEVVTSEYAWLEPIDSLVVVDYNAELTEQGLPVLADAYLDAPVLGYIHVGGWLDVTSGRTEGNFVRVNYNGQGAFVNGSFVELTSEAAPAEPEEEVVWLDDPVDETVPEEPVVEDEVAEEPVVEDEVTEEPVVEDVVAEEPVVEDEVTEEPVVEDEVAEEPVVEDEVTEEPVVEEEVAEEPVVEDEVTEEPVVEDEVAEEPVVEEEAAEEPVVEEVVTSQDVIESDAATAEATETEVATEEVVETEEATEEVVETEAATAEVVETEEATEEVVETEEATEEVVETEEATEEVVATEEATAEVVETEDATEEVVETEEATEEVVETEEATEEVVETEEATEEAQPEPRAPIASTADTFDADAMIGSATVTGTTDGLLCRAGTSPDSPVLMTLAEGTKVLVSAEPVNGYLGIDCGGLQGFADVNYLWSGGAGDEEITESRMDVVVTGTGNGLNCRTGAGLNHSVITTLWDGTNLVTRGAASNGWTPVTCGGQNGFVYTTWIEVANGSGNSGSGNSGNVSSGSAVVNTGGDGLYCRTGAGTTYGIITVLRHGSSVSVRGAQQGDWVPVTCGGAQGFSHASYLNVSSSGSGSDSGNSSETGNSTPTGSVTVANTGGMGLNCRSGAGTGNSIITTLALGQSVQTRSGSTSGWTAVICGGTNGFVSSDFISGGSAGTTPSEPDPTPTNPSGMGNGDHGKTTANLNLRYSASMSSSVSTTVDTGKVVLITGSLSNNFYPVDYDGLTGFMHKDYLNKTNEALSERGGSGTPSNPAPTPSPTPDPGGGDASPTGNAMVDYAMRYLGYPYVWATRGPASFDCSGFTYWVVLNVTGQNIGAGTWTQVSAGTPVSKSNLQAGDLVFFQNTYTAGLSHVGMYIGNGQFIHAQNEATGVVISDLNSSYYGPRWYGAVRV